MYVWSSSYFWYRVPNALRISCDESSKGIFDYVKEVIFGKYPRNLWSQPCVSRIGAFSSTRLSSRKGRKSDWILNSVTSGPWFNLSCLLNEIPIKTSKDRIQRASIWWAGGEAGTEAPGEDTGAPSPFLDAWLYAPLLYSSSWTVSFL